jgi:3'-5' exoribonuclease
VPSLPASQVERLWNEFHGFLDSILNPHLQALRAKIWGDERRAAKYKWHVSAVGHHHNYMGGNIEHVVGIMRAVEALTTSYPQIDRELVLFGAAVHDLGKLDEYAVDATIRVTDEGKLRGHLVMGAETVAQLVEELRAEGHEFPKTLQDHLVHMILSHHGRGAWGSPKPPATPEAFLLHQADYIDSQVKGFLQYVEENKDASADGWARYFDRDIGESRNVRVDWPDEPA